MFVVIVYEMQRLYELGARRVLVPGTGPLGCVPAELATQSTDGQCAKEPQRAAQIFNPQLIQMIKNLNQKLGSDVFISANSMQMHTDFISNPQYFGQSISLQLLLFDFQVPIIFKMGMDTTAWVDQQLIVTLTF